MTRATFLTTYQNAAGSFQTNTSRAVSEAIMRQYAQDISDTFLTSTDVQAVVVTKEFTSAEVLNAFTTPLSIVAAPGAGLVIVPVSFTIYLNYNSAAYATNTTWRFEINGNFVSALESAVLPITQDYMAFLAPTSFSANRTAIENQALKLKVQTGNPTAGNSKIRVKVQYYTQDVTAIP